MHIAIVHVHVKPDVIEPFIAATLDNTTNSVQEAGVVRFDFYQQKEDPTRFTLVEIYFTPEDQENHRKTEHYLRWREAVKDMMAEDRIGIRYKNIFPSDQDWR